MLLPAMKHSSAVEPARGAKLFPAGFRKFLSFFQFEYALCSSGDCPRFECFERGSTLEGTEGDWIEVWSYLLFLMSFLLVPPMDRGWVTVAPTEGPEEGLLVLVSHGVGNHVDLQFLKVQ